MKKKNHLTPDFGPPSQWYNYKCVSCSHETEIEDIVVDAYFYSQACKKGVYPTFTCPKCNKRMKYVNDQKFAPWRCANLIVQEFAFLTPENKGFAMCW